MWLEESVWGVELSLRHEGTSRVLRWDSGKIDGLGCVGSGEPSQAWKRGRDVSGLSRLGGATQHRW